MGLITANNVSVGDAKTRNIYLNVVLIFCTIFKTYMCSFIVVAIPIQAHLVRRLLLAEGILKWALQWRHNERDDVSNSRRLDCFLNCLFRRRIKKTSKLRVTGLWEGNSPVTGEFPAERTSNAENFSIWWYHYGDTNFIDHYICIVN